MSNFTLSRHPRRARRRGFSLIEVLFAIGVMAVGLLGLFAVFITGTRANAFGKHTAEATNHARQVLEIIRSRGLAFKTGSMPPNSSSGFNDGTTQKALNATPPLEMSMLPNTTQFKRNIVTRRASNVPAAYNYDLLECTVTISWEERGTPRSVEVTSLLKGPVI